MSRRTVGFTVAIIVLIFVCVRLALRVSNLENGLKTMQLRLRSFAAETASIIADECEVSIEEATRATRVGYPLQEGSNYKLSLHPHARFGIKYIYDSKGKLTSWEEYPKIIN